MKLTLFAINLLLAATAVCLISSCAYTLPYGGASVEASNGMVRGAENAPVTGMRMAAPLNGTNPLAEERAKKSQAFFQP